MASRTLRVGLLYLQQVRQGQASYTHVLAVAEGLRAGGHDVVLFGPSEHPQSRHPGTRLRQFAVPQRKVMSSRGLDVLYIRAHPAAIVASRWARRNGIPVVQELNGPVTDFTVAWPSMSPFAKIIEKSLKLQMSEASTVIAVTDGLGRYAQAELGASEVAVVNNAAHVAPFIDLEADLPVDLPPRFALFFGQLAPWQGIETLLEAASSDAWPDAVPLLVVGDGPLRGLVAAAHSRHIRLIERLPHRLLPKLIARAAVTLCPMQATVRSQLGLSPLKMYESAALAVPIVASDLPGLREFVAGSECGLLFEPGSPSSLAEAVARIATDEHLMRRLGFNGRRAIANGNNWGSRTAQIQDILWDAVLRDRLDA